MGDPWVAEEGVQGAEARVVAVEGFGVVGGVFEGDEVEFRVGGEVGAGEDLAVFEEGQEGFFEVVLVGGVLRWESVLVDVIELVSTLLCGKEESSGC